MKAGELLVEIRDNLKDYPIEYLKNKATDERYPDSVTKRLAKYNSIVYDDIYEKIISDDFEIKDRIIQNLNEDLTFYFDMYGPDDRQSRDFTRYITLYLALLAKRPLHPFSKSRNDDVYFSDGNYYCKNRVKFLNDERSLCRYCVCRNAGFYGMF